MGFVSGICCKATIKALAARDVFSQPVQESSEAVGTGWRIWRELQRQVEQRDDDKSAKCAADIFLAAIGHSEAAVSLFHAAEVVPQGPPVDGFVCFSAANHGDSENYAISRGKMGQLAGATTVPSLRMLRWSPSFDDSAYYQLAQIKYHQE